MKHHFKVFEPQQENVFHLRKNEAQTAITSMQQESYNTDSNEIINSVYLSMLEKGQIEELEYVSFFRNRKIAVFLRNKEQVESFFTNYFNEQQTQVEKKYFHKILEDYIQNKGNLKYQIKNMKFSRHNNEEEYINCTVTEEKKSEILHYLAFIKLQSMTIYIGQHSIPYTISVDNEISIPETTLDEQIVIESIEKFIETFS